MALSIDAEDSLLLPELFSDPLATVSETFVFTWVPSDDKSTVKKNQNKNNNNKIKHKFKTPLIIATLSSLQTDDKVKKRKCESEERGGKDL